MPNPKFGTVTNDIAAAVPRLQRGVLQFRNDKGGVVSASIGRKSFSDEQLRDNFYAFFGEVMRLRPKAVSGSDLQVQYAGLFATPSGTLSSVKVVSR
jgi:large subunit ribosomal protein L1